MITVSFYTALVYMGQSHHQEYYQVAQEIYQIIHIVLIHSSSVFKIIGTYITYNEKLAFRISSTLSQKMMKAKS